MSQKQLSARCPTELYEALDRARRTQVRALSHQVLHYVREGLLRDGFITNGATAKAGPQ